MPRTLLPIFPGEATPVNDLISWRSPISGSYTTNMEFGSEIGY